MHSFFAANSMGIHAPIPTLNAPLSLCASAQPGSASATSYKDMTAAERDAHIKSCSDLFLAAYRQFEDHGQACDRDEAYKWLQLRDQAVRERLIDEGNNYFQSIGALHGREMRGAVHA